MGTMTREGKQLSRQQRRALERKRGKGVGASGALLTLGVALAAGQAAEAVPMTFTVTNLSDAAVSPVGSLRRAIEDANANPGADTIVFQAALSGVITLSGGQLPVTDSVDIQGPGASAVTVSGNNASRVLYLYNGSAALDITISGLTISGGNDASGGGIRDRDENLTLDGVTLANNHVLTDGAGLWAGGPAMSLTLRNSTVSGNDADDDGGGIYIGDTGGPLLIQNTVISGNDSSGHGGGIYLLAPGDAVTIVDSTISGNDGGGCGGGLLLFDTNGGPVTIQGTTVSGNIANGSGGGLFFSSPDDPILIENSTISGNQVLGTGGPELGVALLGYGGGIYFYNLTAATTVQHTTIAGNAASLTGGGIFAGTGNPTLDHLIVAGNTAGTGRDLGTFANASFDLSFSLVETPGGATINDNGGNLFDQDPLLGPLANNGGPTRTHKPDPTSPVINAGDAAFTPPPSLDQRGFARVGGGRIDMGSVELNPGVIQLALATDSIIESGGTVSIVATRTGGTEGAVSVSYITNDITAIQPGDYGMAGGTLSWADGDGAPKGFPVTIVNDTEDEPNETFSATLSNPQGGAILGSPITEVVTIVDDDLDGGGFPTPIPTLGDYGKLLFAALFGLGGTMLLRRKKTAPAE
jgi:parallel beta-helix repeat protein